jgi:hypothetical protein
MGGRAAPGRRREGRWGARVTYAFDPGLDAVLADKVLAPLKLSLYLDLRSWCGTLDLA